MARKKISKKRIPSWKDIPEVEIKNRKGITPVDFRELGDKKFIANALFGCLKKNDPEGFKEILRIHLYYVNKVSLAKKTGVSKRTLFRMLHPSGNPRLENIAKIIHHLCA